LLERRRNLPVGPGLDHSGEIEPFVRRAILCIVVNVLRGILASRITAFERSLRSRQRRGRAMSIGLAKVFALAVPVCLLACRQPQVQVQPSIEFTSLPPAGAGTGDVLLRIAGHVRGGRPGQRIVLFSRSGLWWVQPLSDRPFTAIQPDSNWKSSIHPGTAYAALLVDPDYRPPSTVHVLPQPGGAIRAVAIAAGPMLAHQPAKTLHFSGYEWEVRQTPGGPGSQTVYDPANAWVDKSGFLHLRIARSSSGWNCADLNLSRSLGYGSYRFVVRDISHLEPAVVLAMSTRDDSEPYREMDIEISSWGQSAGKNAQYMVQPYFVPANILRFQAPAGTLAYSIFWEPGRASFRTIRGSASGGKGEVVAAHTFTSGVPSPETELVRLNFYVFLSQHNPLRQGGEVIVEKFEYLP
jgi:hypothetical protein